MLDSLQFSIRIKVKNKFNFHYFCNNIFKTKIYQPLHKYFLNFLILYFLDLRRNIPKCEQKLLQKNNNYKILRRVIMLQIVILSHLELFRTGYSGVRNGICTLFFSFQQINLVSFFSDSNFKIVEVILNPAFCN